MSDLWQRLVAEEEGASAIWSELLLPEAERLREPAFSPLTGPELALGVETVYEGYLVHYGRPRLFATGDPKLELLLGDRLYARGLVSISRIGNASVVADLAELLELCARLQAENKSGDGALWAAGIARLGKGGISAEGKLLALSGETRPLLELAVETAGEAAVERALSVHQRLFGEAH